MEVKTVHSTNRGQKLFNEDVVAIALQYTRLDSASKAIQWACAPVSKKSYHYLVARDGTVTQLVSPDWVAWHAPRGGMWRGYTNMNMRSIGIALDNLGPLYRGADGTAIPIGSGLRVPDPEVVQGEHRFGRASFRDWHAYSPEQLQSLDSLLAALVPRFKKAQAIIGADDMAPLEQLAPGPALPARFLEIERYR